MKQKQKIKTQRKTGRQTVKKIVRLKDRHPKFRDRVNDREYVRERETETEQKEINVEIDTTLTILCVCFSLVQWIRKFRATFVSYEQTPQLNDAFGLFELDRF